MPKISVIIPCYNSFKFMDKCLNSLENQTYKNFEVIVVDDCSNDDSYYQLTEYQKKTSMDFRVFKNRENIGPGQTRNIAITKAQGEWLCFCDSDDWYELEFLEKMINKVEQLNADMAMCDSYQVFESGNKILCGYTKNIEDYSSKQGLLVHAKSSLCRLIVRKNLFNRLIISPIYYGEDVATIPKLIVNANKIGIVKLPLYNYYIRSGSASNTKGKEISESLIEVFNEIRDYIEGNYNEIYKEEIEYIGINIVLYGATLNAFKGKQKIKEIRKIVSDYTLENNNWYKNSYIKKFDFKKRVYLFCLRYNMYILNKIYATLHSKYINNKA